MTEAASLPLVALTSWQALVERAQVRPGQKVLIRLTALWALCPSTTDPATVPGWMTS
ncbi:hypothetical protein [Streptomyces sp. NPDC049915]|uniref:hypothetical protein n=1 Tax=Streptomyces sp. NPDC049915 TaxID=3155510 RepID=UPI0034131471